ncbi:MAG: hypothetical protein RIQ47_813, partial [Bacteroidota bacterium]
MRYLKSQGLIVLLLLVATAAFGQKKYSTQDARAIRYFEDALSNY